MAKRRAQQQRNKSTSTRCNAVMLASCSQSPCLQQLCSSPVVQGLAGENFFSQRSPRLIITVTRESTLK